MDAAFLLVAVTAGAQRQVFLPSLPGENAIEELMIHSKDNIVRPPWGEEMEEALMEQRRRLLAVPSPPRSLHSRVKIAVRIGVGASAALLGARALYRLFV